MPLRSLHQRLGVGPSCDVDQLGAEDRADRRRQFCRPWLREHVEPQRRAGARHRSLSFWPWWLVTCARSSASRGFGVVWAMAIPEDKARLNDAAVVVCMDDFRWRGR